MKHYIENKSNQVLKCLLALFVFTQFAHAQEAELAFKNAVIYTADANQSFAECIAIKSKKIQFVGSNKECKKYFGNKTKVVDLKNKMVLPGFVDSHTHPVWASDLIKNTLYIGEARYDKDATIKVLKDYATKNPNKEFLEASGYSIAAFGQMPGKEVLDKIFPNTKVFVAESNGHSAWVNSKALEFAGIDKNTPNPPQGTIVKDAKGEPTGQLLENAVNMVLRKFPMRSKAEVAKAYQSMQSFLSSRGLTTMHSMGSGYLPSRQVVRFDGINELAKRGMLNHRLVGSWVVNPAEVKKANSVTDQIDSYIKTGKNYTHPNFYVKSMKFFVDGIVEEKTGLLLEPYCNQIANKKKDCQSSNFGMDIWKSAQQDLAAAFRYVNQNGFQINAHVIGDGAVRRALDALKAAGVPANMRPSFEHIQLAEKSDILRMAKMGVTANMTPLWMALDDYFSTFYFPHLGFERAYNETYPLQSLFDAGINVTSASDWDVTEPDIPFHIFTGLTRLYPQRIYDEYYGDPNYFPYFPDLNKMFTASDFDIKDLSFQPIGTLPPAFERAKSLKQMIHTATINGAKANRIDDITGSLEVGKMADLVVMDTNMFQSFESYKSSKDLKHLEDIANAKVLLTVFEGRETFRNKSFK